jgi:hypothetical protein
MKNAIILFAVCFHTIVSAQTFQTIYDSGGYYEYGHDVVTTADGSAIAAMVDLNNDGMSQACIITQDVAGQPVWKYYYPGSPMSEFNAIIHCSGYYHGGYAVTGYVKDSNGETDIIYLRVDDNGTVMDQMVFPFTGDQFGSSLVEMQTHDIAISGFNANQAILIYIRTDGSVWVQKWGHTTSVSHSIIYQVVATPDTNVLVIGESDDYQTTNSSMGFGGENLMITEFDRNGNYRRQKSYSIDGTANLTGWDVVLFQDKYFICGNVYYEQSSTTAKVCRSFVMCMDTSFATMWIKEYNTDDYVSGPTTQARTIDYAVRRGVLVVGGIVKNTSMNNLDGLLFQVDPSSGGLQMQAAYGGMGGQMFFSLDIDDRTEQIVTTGYDDRGLFSTAPLNIYSTGCMLNSLATRCYQVEQPMDALDPVYYEEMTTPNPDGIEVIIDTRLTDHHMQLIYRNCQSPFAASHAAVYTGPDVAVEKRFFNIFGQQVSSIENQPDGIYIVVETMPNGEVKSKRILISNYK